MIERPILFSAPMVRAVLAGTKTMTRRVVTRRNSDVNGSPPGKLWDRLDWSDASARTQSTLMLAMVGPAEAPHDVHIRVAGPDQTYHRVRPLVEVGDRLWVRETGWEPKEPTARELREGADTWPAYAYDADGISEYEADQFRSWGWKRRPAIHMPRRVSRILLDVTAVRVERLQDISEADAKAEGVEQYQSDGPIVQGPNWSRMRFEDLWQSINCKRPGCDWASNPFVWCISFRRVEAAEARATG